MQGPGAGAIRRSMKRKHHNPHPDALLKHWWRSERPEQSVALLQALHLLLRQGRFNPDSRRKLKQVLHLVGLLRPTLDALLAKTESPVVADLGAGKSYLGFVLYDLVLAPAGRGHVVGVELREELVRQARKLAEESGFERMDFL